MPADRHRNASMALTLIALTLLFLALAMFGPAQPGSTDQATAGSATGVDQPAVEVIDAPGDGAGCGSQRTTCWAPVTMTGAQ